MQLTRPQIADFILLIKEQERLIFKVSSLYAERVEDRKDIFQDIVLQAWSSYGSFKHTAKLTTWLYKVALNTAMNYRRKNNRIRTTDMPDLLNDMAINADAGLEEEYMLMHKLIGRLPQQDKAIIMLYLDDYSYREIAEVTGLSESNVGTKMARIKDKLQTQANQIINA